jgi:hypothetical protein
MKLTSRLSIRRASLSRICCPRLRRQDRRPTAARRLRGARENDVEAARRGGRPLRVLLTNLKPMNGRQIMLAVDQWGSGSAPHGRAGHGRKVSTASACRPRGVRGLPDRRSGAFTSDYPRIRRAMERGRTAVSVSWKVQHQDVKPLRSRRSGGAGHEEVVTRECPRHGIRARDANATLSESSNNCPEFDRLAARSLQSAAGVVSHGGAEDADPDV